MLRKANVEAFKAFHIKVNSRLVKTLSLQTPSYCTMPRWQLKLQPNFRHFTTINSCYYGNKRLFLDPDITISNSPDNGNAKYTSTIII